MSEEDTSVSADGDNETTNSTDTRWKYTGTVLASVIILSIATVIVGAAVGALSLSGIGQSWLLLYSTVVLMAATWAFGKETLEAVQEARGIKNEEEE